MSRLRSYKSSISQESNLRGENHIPHMTQENPFTDTVKKRHYNDITNKVNQFYLITDMEIHTS